MNSVAETILKQLGGNRFIAMTGAKQFVKSANSLKFKIPGNITMDRINTVKITLDESQDLYEVEFGRFISTRPEYLVVSKHEGIYADMLQSIFTTHTGLATRL